LDLAGATIAVTGATGFLGRYIVDVLLARGARVVGVVRSPQKAPELPERGVELRRADLAEPDALAEGFAGADALVSNAALFAMSYHRPAEYLETNLEGTRNVFAAAAKAGVRRVVQVSSCIVYRRGAPRPVGEDAPLRERPRRLRTWNAYAASKALAERAAWQLAAERGIGLTSVRPGGIYGAFDPNFTRVHKAFVRPPVSAYPALFHVSLVYAADVADGIARALERDAALGRAYNLTGGDPAATAWDFLRAWRAAGGRAPALLLPVPVPIRQHYSVRRARDELGWRSRPMLDALRETLAAEAAGPAARRIAVGSAT